MQNQFSHSANQNPMPLNQNPMPLASKSADMPRDQIKMSTHRGDHRLHQLTLRGYSRAVAHSTMQLMSIFNDNRFNTTLPWVVGTTWSSGKVLFCLLLYHPSSAKVTKESDSFQNQRVTKNISIASKITGTIQGWCRKLNPCLSLNLVFSLK